MPFAKMTSTKKMAIITFWPHPPLNTLVLHGASLTPLLDVLHVMPIESTHFRQESEVGPVKPWLSQKLLGVPVIRIHWKFGWWGMCDQYSAALARVGVSGMAELTATSKAELQKMGVLLGHANLLLQHALKPSDAQPAPKQPKSTRTPAPKSAPKPAVFFCWEEWFVHSWQRGYGRGLGGQKPWKLHWCFSISCAMGTIMDEFATGLLKKW